MGLISSGMTHVGQKRKSNQDSIYINRKKHIYLVADGMGGHRGGDIASAIAVKVIPEFIIENFTQEPSELNLNSIQMANQAIKSKSMTDELLLGMGTTVVNLFFKGDTAYIGNVGDSRAYLVNQKRLYQLTKDHSLVQEKINMGIYTREQAAQDPQKNVLTKTVGFEDEVDADVFNYKVAKHDIFMTCSDGLHGMVSEPDMLYIINKHFSDLDNITQQNVDDAVKELIDLANANGGKDNVSVIIVFAQ